MGLSRVSSRDQAPLLVMSIGSRLVNALPCFIYIHYGLKYVLNTVRVCHLLILNGEGLKRKMSLNPMIFAVGQPVDN